MAFEYKFTALRETAPEVFQCDTPERAAQYWREHIATAPAFNPDVEGLYVVLLNTRRNVKGHVLISTGTLDTLLVHPRETYRAAIVGAASAIVLMHNLCAAAHKLCYVTLRVMCSARLAGLALLQPSGRRECCGFA